jgi:hypothetical protein
MKILDRFVLVFLLTAGLALGQVLKIKDYQNQNGCRCADLAEQAYDRNKGPYPMTVLNHGGPHSAVGYGERAFHDLILRQRSTSIELIRRALEAKAHSEDVDRLVVLWRLTRAPNCLEYSQPTVSTNIET